MTIALLAPIPMSAEPTCRARRMIAAVAKYMQPAVCQQKASGSVSGSGIGEQGVRDGGVGTLTPPHDLAAALILLREEARHPDCRFAARSSLLGRSPIGKTNREYPCSGYRRNDHFFGPRLSRNSQVLLSGGGKVNFVKAAPFGTDGHQLFSTASGIRSGRRSWPVFSRPKQPLLVLRDDRSNNVPRAE